ncbi:MAG: hypothetical protein ACK41P_00860 [Asticcacaulis sp.]
MLNRLTLVALNGAALAAMMILAGCSQKIEAPFDKGVCYHAVEKDDGKIQYNKIADNQPNIENCAARLEEVRQSFLRLGSNRRTIMGAYNGSFIFIEGRVIKMATHYKGPRITLLIRTDDGRLVTPGAVAQP